MVDALVTGATGFIGRHLVRELLARRQTVRCLVRKSSDVNVLPRESVQLHTGDVVEPHTLEGAADGVAVVYHLAALGHVGAVTDEAYRRFVEVNVTGTRHLIEECLRASIRKFLHASSTAAMGLIPSRTVDESTEPRPVTPYQRSKLQGEREVLRYWQQRQFPAVIARPSMVYGPEGEGSEFLRVARLVRRRRFPIFGRGRKLTPGVYVSDLVAGLILAAEKGRAGEVYILTGRESFEFDRMLDLIARSLGVRRPGPHLPMWFGFAAGWCFEMLSKLTRATPAMTRQNLRSLTADRVFSIDKARRELGYEPLVPLAEGVERTVTWAQEHGLL